MYQHHLLGRLGSLVDPVSYVLADEVQMFEIPTDMFPRYSNTSHIAVETVKFVNMCHQC